MAEPRASLPTVSVVTPTRDRPTLLPRALRSLLAQRHADWEWIVIDDGSAAGATAAIDRADARIHLHRNAAASGAAAARNRGIALASAPLVAFLDDDDEYEPQYLDAVVTAFARQPAASFCMTGVTRVYADGTARAEPFDADAADIDFLRKASASRGLALRTATLRQLGGFDESLGVSEDIDLLMRAVAAGARALFLREPLVRIHEHAGTSLSRASKASVHVAASESLWRRHQPIFAAHRALWRHYGGVHAANLYRAGRRVEARAMLRELASHVDAVPRALEILFRFECRPH